MDLSEEERLGCWLSGLGGGHLMPAHLSHSSVLPDDSRAGRQRTRVVRHSLSPVFNHTMVYDGFGPPDLRQACAELSLWDHGALASRQLGGTRLSLGTGKQSRALKGVEPEAEAQCVALGTSLPFPELFLSSSGGDWALRNLGPDRCLLGPNVSRVTMPSSCAHPHLGSSYGLQVPWMDSTPEEKQLWQTLLERPCEWVDGLLPLRTNLVPRA